jgi:hypothetical protein
MSPIARPAVILIALVVTARLAAQGQTPADHLSQAERMLSAVPQDSLKKDAQKQMNELRGHFGELVSAYRTNPDPFVPPAATQSAGAKADAKSEPVNWKQKFSDVEKDLAAILGGVPVPPPAEVRRQLEQFRLELELFFASATNYLGRGGIGSAGSGQNSLER